MKDPISITGSIYWIGVNDRETFLFESLWPLPRGIAYNAYFIDDEKTVLIDTVKAPYQTDFLHMVQKLLGERKKVDYLVINHMEPDHSGAISVLKEIYPDLVIVGNKKTKTFLEGFYGVNDNFLVVDDGDELNLGKYTLQFHITPMVHWPETMMTFEKSTGLLFSGDAFGGFGTLDGGIFDDEVDMSFYGDETLRYFSNIVGKFSPMVQKAINKLKDLEIKTIAATHGPILRKDPQKIVNDYDRWSAFETEKGAVVVYASMYGNTKKMAEEVARSLAVNGIEKVVLHDISRSHISYIIRDIWRYSGVVLGSCTYNMKIFPPMEMLLDFFESAKMKNRKLGIFGSFSWSGGALKRLVEFAEKSKWEMVEPSPEVKHAPGEDDLERCTELGKNLALSL